MSARTSRPLRSLESFDAVALAGGAELARDLPAPGRDLYGVYYAMEFLPQQNRRVSGEPLGTNEPILAAGKHVVVIGGGDTGSDCIGTSIRQGALKVTQLEIMPTPPKVEDKMLNWPNWPVKLRTSSSHEEGAERDFAVMTRKFEGENGVVTGIECVRLDDKMKPIEGSEFTLKADLVLLAMGFVSPVKEGLLDRSRRRARRRAATCWPTPSATPRRSPRCSPAATCGAGSRWWCGRSARGGNARPPSTRR